MKVKLSFGQKTVISSLSKLTFESKNLFYKSCSVWYAIWEFWMKSETLALIGHKTVISSLSKLKTNQKNFFFKSCSIFYTFLRFSHKKWMSFCHFLNKTSIQKTSLQKLLSLVCDLWMCHKKWKLSCHFVIF